MPETKLISYKGRRFVQLCQCNSDWGTDCKTYDVSGNEQKGQVATTDLLFEKSLGLCPVCRYYPWIILPKGEKV